MPALWKHCPNRTWSIYSVRYRILSKLPGKTKTGFKNFFIACYDVIKSLSLLNSLLLLDWKRLLKASPTSFNTALKLMRWGAELFFIHWILNVKTTNIIYWIQAQFCWFLIQVISEGFCLFHSRPIYITPEPAVLFVITDGINIRVLPDLSDKIFNDLNYHMRGLGLIFGFVHREIDLYWM